MDVVLFYFILSIKSIMQFTVSGDQLLPTVLLGKCIDIYSEKQRKRKGYMHRVLADKIKSVQVRQA